MPAARKVASALRALSAAPRSGRRYPDDSPFRSLYYKTVVVKVRRWSYRITYELRDDEIWVLYLYPSSQPLTHSAIAATPLDDE